MDRTLGLVLFASEVALSLAGEYCYIEHDHGYEYEYCDHGCCKNDYKKYCCNPGSWVLVLAIVGGVIIFCLGVPFVIWCCAKHMGSQRRGIAPERSTTTTESDTNASMHNFGNQPKPYFMQTGFHPPPYYMQTVPEPPPYPMLSGSQPSPYSMQTEQNPPPYPATSTCPSQQIACPSQPASYN